MGGRKFLLPFDCIELSGELGTWALERWGTGAKDETLQCSNAETKRLSFLFHIQGRTVLGKADFGRQTNALNSSSG